MFFKRKDSELDREVAHHLHELTAEYQRQGYSRGDAVRMANREFGGSTQVKEQCREERPWAWLMGVKQDIVFGLRMMRRTPAITAAAVLSLALGIGAHTAIISLMDLVLWRDLPVPEPRQLVLVEWKGHGFPRENADGASGSMSKVDGVDVADFFSWPAFTRMRSEAAALGSIAAYSFPGQISISYAGRPTVAKERPVSGNFFATLQVHPALGRLLMDSDDSYAAPAAVAVSYSFWTRALGSDPNAIGQTMNIDNHPFLIAGVVEPSFYGLSPGDATDVYTPFHHAALVRRPSQGVGPLENQRFWGTQLLARLAPGVTEARLQPAMDTIFRSSWERPAKDLATAPRISLNEGRRGQGFLRTEFKNPLLVLGALVSLLLMIACVNIANLLLARANARQGELAMRIALGCGRFRLMRQLLTESALLAVLGGAASVGVAAATATLLGRFLAGHETTPIAFVLDLRTLVTVGGITTLALLAFGLLPAFQASRKLPAPWIRQSTGSRGRWNSGRLFVTFQMALSVILVMSAVTFTRNLLAVQSADPGFDRRNLILFGTRPGTSGYDKARLSQFYSNLEQRLQAIPGVATAGLASVRPMNLGGWWETVHLAGETEQNNVSVNGVTPSYLPVYSAAMVAGRNFTRADLTDPPTVAVISEDLARKLGGISVLGRRLAVADGPPGRTPPVYDIIGIAPPINATSIKERPFVLWLPFEARTPEATVVLRTTQPPQAILPSVRQAMLDIDPNLPMVDLITMEDQISKGLQRERMFATLCNGFGILALVLSIVGLYGVISYSTSRRRSEIGVRLALGARPRAVLSMILREGLAMSVLGVALGVPIVWLCGKYLQKELTNMKAVDLLTLIIAPGILLLAAVVATALPALRASALDPAETLRQD